MSFWDGLQHRLHVLLHRRGYDREIAAEREFHLALEAKQQEHAAHGAISEAEARAAARRRYGNLTLHNEDTRHMAGLSFFETASQDLRFALRGFRRTPGFTAIAVATLAIGIGANTAIFSAIDALLLRPLPFAEPERLMKVSITRAARGEHPSNDDAVWSWPKFVIFRSAQNVFADLGLHTDLEVTIRGNEGAERLRAEMTETGYFRALGVRPALGRAFAAEEDSVVGGPKTVVLSHALFTRRYNADSSVVGKSVNIAGEQYAVVGVMGEKFRGLSGRAELWVPILALDPTVVDYAWSHSFSAVARIKPGVSVGQAKAAVVQAGAAVDRTYPDPSFKDTQDGAIGRELDATRVDPVVRRSLFILFGAVGLVLLIACANVANLFLVRAAGRGHEIAVRMAVGATRGRLVRQLLTESLMLATVGGALGVFVAWGSVRMLSSLDPARALNARSLGGIGAVNFEGIRLDPVALAVALGLSVLTGLLFGIVPAFHSTRSTLADGLRHGRDRSRGAGWLGVNIRSVIVSIEVALAVVLLAGSGLMMRSLGNLLAISPGFQAEGILTMRVNVREGSSRDSMPGFYEAVMRSLDGLPSVEGVTLADCPPLNGGCNGTSMWRNDRPPLPPGTEPATGVHWITPNWPTVMDVPLKGGRLFESGDRAGSRKVVLVSESAARRLWPNEDPLGKPMGAGQGGFDSAYVVGVVADVRYNTIDSLPGSDVYLPFAQSPRGRMMIMLRTTGNPEALVPWVRTAMRDIAPDLPVYDVRTMSSRVADSTAYARFGTILLMLFGAVALALATLGVYGVISFSVSQRTREIGIRMALGATARGVVRVIVGQGLTVAAAGAAVGLALAIASSGVLESMLHGVAPADPLTFAAITAVLLAAVALASWIPARRAAGIQPTEALREE